MFSSFGGKHTFFSFDGKTYFPVLAEKHNFQGLAGNMFWVSSGKHVFSFLSGNIFFGFWRDNMVSDSVRKHVFLWENMFFFCAKNAFSDFGEKMHISSFRGITCFCFLAEKCVFGFQRENVFSGFAEKHVFGFRRKITIFGLKLIILYNNYNN